MPILQSLFSDAVMIAALKVKFHCIQGLTEIKTLHPRDKIMSKICRMRR